MCISYCWDGNQLLCKCRETSAVMWCVSRPYLRSRTNWLTVESSLRTWELSGRTQNLHLGLRQRGRGSKKGSNGQREVKFKENPTSTANCFCQYLSCCFTVLLFLQTQTWSVKPKRKRKSSTKKQGDIYKTNYFLRLMRPMYLFLFDLG